MQNLEAKFRLQSLERARSRAESIGFAFRSVLPQRDTFFVVQSGKLKLREQEDGASLIYYRRDHSDGLEVSRYEIVPVSKPEAMLEILSVALGVRAEVRKRRVLLMRRNVRLHLDEVEGLGTFGEIEAVVEPGGSSESYRSEVAVILAALEIDNGDLIEVSYFELMLAR